MHHSSTQSFSGLVPVFRVHRSFLRPCPSAAAAARTAPPTAPPRRRAGGAARNGGGRKRGASAGRHTRNGPRSDSKDALRPVLRLRARLRPGRGRRGREAPPAWPSSTPASPAALVSTAGAPRSKGLLKKCARRGSGVAGGAAPTPPAARRHALARARHRRRRSTAARRRRCSRGGTTSTPRTKSGRTTTRQRRLRIHLRPSSPAVGAASPSTAYSSLATAQRARSARRATCSCAKAGTCWSTAPGRMSGWLTRCAPSAEPSGTSCRTPMTSPAIMSGTVRTGTVARPCALRSRACVLTVSRTGTPTRRHPRLFASSTGPALR